MATVTSFEEFLTAVAGSEEVVLANDLDASNGGVEYRNPITINCNVNGAGHSISNLSIQGAYGLSLGEGVVLQNLEFINLLVKATADVTLFSGTGSKIEYCKFGAQLDCGNLRAWGLAPQNIRANVYHSAFDVTVKNAPMGMRYAILIWFYYSNVLIRDANFDYGGAITLGNFTNSALVLENCTRTSNYSTRFNSTYSAHITFKNCTFANTVSGSAHSLFCNDGGSVTGSGFTEVTAEQIKSEEYLRSIGFLP